MIRIVFTTFSSTEDAAAAVKTLVGEKLAACGTILPGARSIYHWQGKVEDTTETVVIFKTSRARHHDFVARLAAVHPFDTPEIVAIDPDCVADKYAAWVLASTDHGGDDT